MSKRHNNAEFAGTESELNAMTKELDELHNDSAVSSMWAGVSNMIDGMRGAEGITRSTSRRTFLMGAGAAMAGGATLLAVGSTPGLAGAATRAESRLHLADAAAFPPASYEGRPRRSCGGSQLGESGCLRLQRRPHRGSGEQARRRTGRRGELRHHGQGQHTQHAAAWNAVLKSNGKKPITVTNPTLTPTIQAAFAKVTDVTGLAQLALMLEMAAAATYQAETSMLKSKAAIGLSASIEPVEMQHIAILYYVMGHVPRLADHCRLTHRLQFHQRGGVNRCVRG